MTSSERVDGVTKILLPEACASPTLKNEFSLQLRIGHQEAVNPEVGAGRGKPVHVHIHTLVTKEKSDKPKKKKVKAG